MTIQWFAIKANDAWEASQILSNSACLFVSKSKFYEWAGAILYLRKTKDQTRS